MEETVLQWHSHISHPSAPGMGTAGVKPPAPSVCRADAVWSWSSWLGLTVDSLPRGLERLPCDHVACAASLKYFYWINALFKRLLSVFPMETSSSNSSFFVAYRNSRRTTRFTISLSPSWGCFFSISVFTLSAEKWEISTQRPLNKRNHEMDPQLKYSV